MVSRKVVAAVGLVAMSLFSKTARAEEAIPLADELTLERPAYLADAPTPPEKPLASLMKQYGMNSEKLFGFNIYGFVEGSYTASFNNPPGNFITGRVFDVDHEEVLLNQVDLSIEKVLDCAACAKENRWDVGGKVEVIYGADARFIHANGLNFYGGASPQLSPENQFDLVQAYVDVVVPIGNGLLLRGGKFVTLLGYETINPTTDPLYSHSYLFGYAIPFTHTGLLASYNLTDKLSVTGGATRGWEQSLVDNNGSMDALGQVKYIFNEKLTGFFNFVTGPEGASNGLWRTVFDGVVVYQMTDALSLGANADYGFEPGASATDNSAEWYGVALYAGYKVCDYLTVNARGEWFADPDQARGLSGNMYEVTLGLGIKPAPSDKYLSNLLIRPEIRYDYSEDGIFDGGAEDSQWTAAIDAIFTF